MKKKVLSLLLATMMIMGSSICVCAEETEITESSEVKSAEIEVVVNIDSQFVIGIPTSASISAFSGTGSYQVSVKGDLDPRYKLVVAPEDACLDKDGINFQLTDQSETLTPKDPVTVDITSEKTEFICTDINSTEFTTVNCSLAVSEGELSAGDWKGTIRYNASLELIEENAEG